MRESQGGNPIGKALVMKIILILYIYGKSSSHHHARLFVVEAMSIVLLGSKPTEIIQ